MSQEIPKKIFVTSSWINRHAVDLLQQVLEAEGYVSGSFVADNDNEFSVIGQNRDVWAQNIDYGMWVMGDEGRKVFDRDIQGVKDSDIVVVIEPAGRDSWAHVGLAYALGKTIVGLNSRGRKVGLMRRMCLYWCDNYQELRYFLKEGKPPAKIRRV